MTASNSIPFPIPKQASPFVLYRFYDAEGTLLYVGITNNLRRRCEEHRLKGWFPEIVRVHVVPCRNVEQAAEMEELAIAAGGPRYNRARRGSTGPRVVSDKPFTVRIPGPMLEWLETAADERGIDVREMVLRCVERTWEMDGLTPDLSVQPRR